MNTTNFEYMLTLEKTGTVTQTAEHFYNCYPAPSVSALYPIIIHARTLD